MSLQARVAAAAAVAIVVAVAALGIAVLARLDNQLNDALDRQLRARATEVARLAASTPQLLTEPGTLEGRLGGSQLLVQVIDPQRRIVARSSGLGSRVLPDAPVIADALEDRSAGYGDARLGTDPVRVYAAPLGELGRGPVAESLARLARAQEAFATGGELLDGHVPADLSAGLAAWLRARHDPDA